MKINNNKSRKNAAYLIFAIVIISFAFVFGVKLIDAHDFISGIIIILMVIAVIICVTYLIPRIYFKNEVYNTEYEIRKQTEDLESLILKYSLIVNLVEKEAKEAKAEIESDCKIANLFEISNDLSYLKEYDNLKKAYMDANIFLSAAILIKAIITNYVIVKKDENIWMIKDVELKKNIIFAFSIALKLIAKPTILYKNSKGEIKEKNYPNVKVFIPKGILEDGDLYSNIVEHIYKEVMSGKDISVLYLSDMLHLLYLYSLRDTISDQK